MQDLNKAYRIKEQAAYAAERRKAMALLEQWRKLAYDQDADKGKLQRFWADYFEKEKEIYAQLLKAPDEVVKGTVKELADAFSGERDDRRLMEMVRSLYDFMQSHPFTSVLFSPV